MRIADANFVLRYLLEDVVDQFEIARGVLESQAVFIPFEVVAEVVYVLQGVYEVPNPEIADSLSSLLPGQSVLRDHEILTFDRKLARMIGRTKST